MTRDEIMTAVQQQLNRFDMAPRVPSWLSSAHNRINTKLRVGQMITRVVKVLDCNNFQGPDGFLQAESIELNAAPTVESEGAGRGGSSLRYVSSDQLNNELAYIRSGRRLASPLPSFYTIRGLDHIEILPWYGTSTPYQMEMWYFKKVPVPQNGSDTNWLLQSDPQLVLNAMMIFGHQAVFEYQEAALHEAAIDKQIQELNDAYRASKASAGPLVMPAPRKMGGRHS